MPGPEPGGVAVEAYPADWKAHGAAAGQIRNRQMLACGKPDVVVSFPGGSGTLDMVHKAKRVPVIRVGV